MIELKVPAAEFLTAIKRVKHCVGGNGARKNLMGINLSVHTDNLRLLRVTAADSFRIARQEIEIEKAEPFSVTVHSEEMQRMSDMSHESSVLQIKGTFTLGIEKNRLTMDGWELRSLDSSYPPLDRLFKPPVEIICITRIKQFYKAVDFLYEADTRDLKLSVSDNGYNLVLSSSPGGYSGCTFPLAAQVKTFKPVGLLIKYLKDALRVFKVHKAERLWLQSDGNGNPVFLHSDLKGFSQLIMGVKLK